jgi:hypothetical protein
MTLKGKNGKWRTALPHELEKQINWIMQVPSPHPIGRSCWILARKGLQFPVQVRA